MVTPHDAVLQEFRSHYLADELPLHMGGLIAGMAAASAGRLSRRVLEADLPAIAFLLRAMSAGPHHPTVRAVEEETAIEWIEHPDQWAELSQLLARVAVELAQVHGGTRAG